MPPNMITLYLAGQSALFLSGIETLLSKEKNLRLLRVCTNFQELHLVLQQHPLPRVLLLDLSLLGTEALVLCKQIKRKHPRQRLLVIHQDSSLRTIRSFLRQGVKGYIRPQMDPTTLPTAIREIASGNNYIDPELRRCLSDESLGIQAAPTDHLTKREQQVLRLIVEEFTTKEIAKKLFISNCTVETHRINIIQKLGVKNTAGMVREAMRRELYVE